MSVADELELQIQAVLSSIAQSLDKRPDGECTSRVMKELETLGSRLGWKVKGGSSDTANPHPEFLFDMTWVRLHGQSILDLELVVESEWKPEGVQYDFQKLMVGRARHRLMIFPQRSRELAWTAINLHITEIQNYRLTQQGDRYLFAVWHNEGAEFEFRVYVHG